MKTINRLVKQSWFSRAEIAVYRKMGICNWAWWKWGIKFTQELRKLKFFDKWKEKQLLKDIDLISDIHDIRFHIWGWVFSFLRANYNFSCNMMQLFRWTTPMSRFLMFLTLMLWLNTIWIKYYIFNK